jgi:methylmalonyl-CoA/ethylmalonyl-CoA epimerase
MKIHHIGYVVKDIKKYKKNLVIDNILKEVYDDTQNAKLVLIKSENIFIELIEPQNQNAFTYNFLKKSGGYHHLCYETTKEGAELLIKEKKMIKVLDWVYASLLDGDVCFAYNRNKEVVEFVCLKK